MKSEQTPKVGRREFLRTLGVGARRPPQPPRRCLAQPVPTPKAGMKSAGPDTSRTRRTSRPYYRVNRYPAK